MTAIIDAPAHIGDTLFYDQQEDNSTEVLFGNNSPVLVNQSDEFIEVQNCHISFSPKYKADVCYLNYTADTTKNKYYIGIKHFPIDHEVIQGTVRHSLRVSDGYILFVKPDVVIRCGTTLITFSNRGGGYRFHTMAS